MNVLLHIMFQWENCPLDFKNNSYPPVYQVTPSKFGTYE